MMLFPDSITKFDGVMVKLVGLGIVINPVKNAAATLATMIATTKTAIKIVRRSRMMLTTSNDPERYLNMF
jgi:hypothetical protein